MLTVEKLRSFGADVDDGIRRLMGNESFYLRMVTMACKDDKNDFGNMKAAIEAGNMHAAYDPAHNLKGVMGNLSLTPVFEPVRDVSDFLKEQINQGSDDAQIFKAWEEGGYPEKLKLIMELKGQLDEMIED